MKRVMSLAMVVMLALSFSGCKTMCCGTCKKAQAAKAVACKKCPEGQCKCPKQACTKCAPDACKCSK